MRKILGAVFVLSISLALGCGGATTYSISGTIGGASSVTVSLTGAATQEVVTASGGTYAFTGLGVGSYAVTPSKAGFTFAPTSKAVSLSADSTGNDFTALAAPLPSNVTLTATLSDPLPTGAAGIALEAAASAATSWAGYQLYCITFGAVPVAAAGTADATGQLSLTFAAKDVAFGCFVLDPAGKGVATLLFSNGVQSGQTLMLASNSDLGWVPVSLLTGVAIALVPVGGTLVTTTPASATCPSGTWTFDGGLSEGCPGNRITADSWIALGPTGNFLSSFTLYFATARGPVCGAESWAAVPTSYAGGTLVIGPFDASKPGCPTKTNTVTLTVAADCRTMVGTLVESGCFAGCTCKTFPITVVKQ